MIDLLLLTAGKFEGAYPGDLSPDDLTHCFRNGNSLDRAIIESFQQQQRRHQRRKARLSTPGGRFHQTGVREAMPGVITRAHGRFSGVAA
jgi:hypothetical protein